MPLGSSNSIRKPLDVPYGIKESAVFNFFNAVYAWMCVGLGVTALSAYCVSRNEHLMAILFQRGVITAWLLGTVLFVYVIRSVALKINAAVGTMLFLIYAAIIGMMLSGIFVMYQLPSIVGAFVMTAGVFGAMSVYGFITKRDLTTMGSFLMMAVVGIFIAVLVNIFLQSDALSWALTFIILFVFTGLTAYRTQWLKRFAYQSEGNSQFASRMVVIGSLLLYIDFINIFMSLLRITGKRR